MASGVGSVGTLSGAVSTYTVGREMEGLAMDAVEAITTRRSVRTFRSDPVPRAVLERVLETTRFAPSWGNTQSWGFVVLGGRLLDRIKQALEMKERAGEPPSPELPWPVFRGQYADRRRGLALRMLEKIGLSEEDSDARRRLAVRNIRFFEAPHAIVGTLDRLTAPYALVDLGIALQTIALAAHHYSLGTCIQAKVITYPDVYREALRIPENRLIALGMAIGYPDLEAPLNQLERERRPLESFVTWLDDGQRRGG
jgi:nitroreductase